jgi:hypothetical protein
MPRGPSGRKGSCLGRRRRINWAGRAQFPIRAAAVSRRIGEKLSTRGRVGEGRPHGGVAGASREMGIPQQDQSCGRADFVKDQRDGGCSLQNLNATVQDRVRNLQPAKTGQDHGGKPRIDGSRLDPAISGPFWTRDPGQPSDNITTSPSRGTGRVSRYRRPFAPPYRNGVAERWKPQSNVPRRLFRKA